METENKKTVLDRANRGVSFIISKLYDSAFNDGRHSCREKYVDSGLLIVNQEKIEEALIDPCKDCEYCTRTLKIGCMCSVVDCERKQKQLLALEINKYFKKKEER